MYTNINYIRSSDMADCLTTNYRKKVPSVEEINSVISVTMYITCHSMIHP